MKETRAAKKRRLIKLIHVAKGQLMLADGDYRALLANASCGKTSSTKLSVDELETVLRRLKARGFVVTTKAQAAGGQADIPVHDNNAQVAMIRSLWLELHRLGAVRDPSERALAKFVQRHTGIAYQGWLGIDNASKIIEHLKKWRNRVRL
ncbi:regulatory protein GemA [Uruburuella testudinis]|uniref:Regulatory protein GemA n=1 Tax=Uruburuella testudinis TaxID=1282863 RepID=A0ABY4DVB5_9NEIS|nr:regulatory protein GemA [Uruburuella testudinis]UOO82778.1 regulatory protein GemA [Uruburuella testudinis]